MHTGVILRLADARRPGGRIVRPLTCGNRLVVGCVLAKGDLVTLNRRRTVKNLTSIPRMRGLRAQAHVEVAAVESGLVTAGWPDH